VNALLILAAIVLLIQTAIFVVNSVYWRRTVPVDDASPKLSVLIPARNERQNLPELLFALAQQETPPHEVLVCDDASTDGTDAWLKAHAAAYDAQWFRAPQKPEGWVGKCWACHQLGLRATGDWLVFLDADVRPGPQFLTQLAAWMAHTDAFLVTALPAFIPAGPGDGALVAMVPFSVFTLLPLARAELDPRPAFAFANGQLIGLRRDDYQCQWPHQQVRAAILEDVALARWVKQLGAKILILDATTWLRVQMYRGAGQAVQGFARNAALICGGNLGALLVALFVALTYLLPWAAGFNGAHAAWLLVAWGAALYGGCAARFGFGAGYALLTPAAAILTVLTLLRSVFWRLRRTVVWKDRVYPS
jgi:chlorobactene glucosyltransferase